MGLGCSHVRASDLALTSFCVEGGTVAPEGQQGKSVLQRLSYLRALSEPSKQ